ncbi:MAG TPA: ROK family protein [Planctomycetaceae bacterium]|nr:ROK family protein [Planctomycetaceae bacterium]
MRSFLGIEIGGTKLQIAVGRGEGEPFRGFWRGTIDAQAGAGRIQEQIVVGVDELLSRTGLTREAIAGVGIGFGGPVDSAGGRIVVSNQVAGWQGFPVVEWAQERLGWPAVLHNDADTAALAEARFGAGRGFDPVMYVTVGSGIGGGLVIGGKIYRGQGAGAMEIGHLRPSRSRLRISLPAPSVESVASGFGVENRARLTLEEWLQANPPSARGRPAAIPDRLLPLMELVQNPSAGLTTRRIAECAIAGDAFSRDLLADATDTLGWALAQAATLLNPGRIVIGGGVSLIGEEYFFQPVRRAFGEAVFQPFAGLAEIVPAALGEDVVVFGALALARDAFN